MKRFLVCLLPMVCCLPPSHAAEILAGKLTEVSGEVEVQKRGAATWTKATRNMLVNPGDQINTGLTGKASLSFKNSVTEIAPLTQFVVGRAFEDANNVNTELFLQIGKVTSQVDPKSAKKNKFTVTTPTAVAGIRGTRQECSFDKGFGTKVEIREGAGYMSPVKAENLPPAVQAMLAIAPAGGGREGGVGKGDEKGKGSDAPMSVQQAVAEFNTWIQQSEQALSSGGGAAEGQPLLDASTLDYVIAVADGFTASIQNSSDPTATVEPLAALAEATAPSVLPAGSTPAEAKAALTSTEVVDAPVTVTVIEAVTSTQQVLQQTGVSTSTSSTTTSITPPNRPTQGQSQGQ